MGLERYKIIQNCMAYEGFTDKFHLCIMDYVCTKTLKKNIAIDLGVWKGRTLKLMDYNFAKTLGFDFRIFEGFSKEEFKNSSIITGNLLQKQSDFVNLIDKVDLIHIDANHTYYNTIKGLEIADKLLNISGIAVVDDVDEYNTVFASIMYYLNSSKTFVLFLRTKNKFYLCRPDFLNYYLSIITDGLIGEIFNSYGIKIKVTLSNINNTLITITEEKEKEHKPSLMLHNDYYWEQYNDVDGIVFPTIYKKDDFFKRLKGKCATDVDFLSD
jgi:hypothetical protein